MTAAPDFPLRIGGTEDFRRVRSALRGAGFEEEPVRRLLGIATLGDLGSVRRELLDLDSESSRKLGILIRLFMLLEVVPKPDLERAIDTATIDALWALDLVRNDRGSTGLYSPILLYPVAGFFITSDRHENHDGTPFVPPPDIVFPALFHGTLRFLRVMPTTPTGDALDLCSGTGIGALVLSRHARRVVASDITERSCHFARFNQQLNACDNVEVARGDLYDAVSGQTFDRIIAHPPYVPALADSQVFRDAGETGESVVQRIVAGLAQRLRPGGAFYAVSAGWDLADAPFEERIRGWLGARSSEFDLIFALQEEMTPARVAGWLSERSAGAAPDTRTRLAERFRDAGLERSVYGAVAVQRSGSAAPDRRAVTARPRLSTQTTGSDLEWALRWYRWRIESEASGDLANALLHTIPKLGPALQVKTTHEVRDGRLIEKSVVLEAERPFHSGTRIDAWMLPLISQLNGEKPAKEVLAGAREAGQLPEGFTEGDFTALLSAMVERGYVTVDASLFDH